MGDISQILAVTRREHSDSFSSDATQSTASRLALRHRLNQLMTCLDDLDPSNDLHDKVVKTLDNAFVVCGTRASKPKKDKFRWWEYLYLSYRNSFTVLRRFSFVVDPSCCCWILWTHDYSHYLLFMVRSWFLCFSSTVLLLYWLWQCWCVLLWFRLYSMKPFQELKIHLFIWRFLRFRLTLFELDIKHAAQYLFFYFSPRLHVVTWNVATVEPPDDVSSLLHLNSPKSADLYIIGYRVLIGCWGFQDFVCATIGHKWN